MRQPSGEHLEHCVDATIGAHAELELARDFTLDALPRLREAGAKGSTRLELRLRFLRVGQHTAAQGILRGQLELVCQRCLGPLQVALQESFKVIVVADEVAMAHEYDDYEPILVDPTRFDLQWLAEEQGLLALPLVARHAIDECGIGEPARDSAAAQGTQRPFGNLRDMLRGR